ncbi:MAG: GNAT family N-acetyltransferase [Gaiella sp.]|nr:GNAT family N-acetyltransferase [Gaiella sp.]
MTLRCWEPRDAPLLAEAIESSLDHLRPWLPWAREEPRPLDERIELLRAFRGRFDLGEDFVYGVFTPDGRTVVGGSGLHTRAGTGALEIGYWIRASGVRQGFARETAAALTAVAFHVCGVDRVVIRVDPGNEASLRVPRALGFGEEGKLRRRLPAGEDEAPRGAVVFALFADQLEGSPVAHSTLEAYDALGRPIAL